MKTQVSRFWRAFFALLLSAITTNAAVPKSGMLDGATGTIVEQAPHGRRIGLMGAGHQTRTNLNTNIAITLIAVTGPIQPKTIQADGGLFQLRALSLLPEEGKPLSLVAPVSGSQENDPQVAARALWHIPDNNMGSQHLPLWKGKPLSASSPHVEQRGTATYGTMEVVARNGATFNPNRVHTQIRWEGTPIEPVYRDPQPADTFGPGAVGKLGAETFTSGSINREVSEFRHAGFSGFLVAETPQGVLDVRNYILTWKPALIITVWLTDEVGTVIAIASVRLEVPPNPLPSPGLSYAWAQTQGTYWVNAGEAHPVVIESAPTASGPWTAIAAGKNASVRRAVGAATPGTNSGEFFRGRSPVQ